MIDVNLVVALRTRFDPKSFIYLCFVLVKTNVGIINDYGSLEICLGYSF